MQQEQDENLGAPTMTGIMSGAYYFQRGKMGPTKAPRQEWDYEMRAPLATVLIEGRMTAARIGVTLMQESFTGVQKRTWRICTKDESRREQG